MAFDGTQRTGLGLGGPGRAAGLFADKALAGAGLADRRTEIRLSGPGAYRGPFLAKQLADGGGAVDAAQITRIGIAGPGRYRGPFAAKMLGSEEQGRVRSPMVKLGRMM